MQYTQNTIELVKHYEGLHDGDLRTIGLQPKMCPAGIWTIGYGHAVQDPVTHKFLKGEHDHLRALELYPAMTEQQAELLLLDDLDKFAAIARAHLNVRMNDDRFGALISFAFNEGAGNLLSSTLLKKVNRSDFEGAAAEFIRWNKATVNGQLKVLPGLTYRRMSEAHLFLTGKLKFFN